MRMLFLIPLIVLLGCKASQHEKDWANVPHSGCDAAYGQLHYIPSIDDNAYCHGYLTEAEKLGVLQPITVTPPMSVALVAVDHPAPKAARKVHTVRCENGWMVGNAADCPEPDPKPQDMNTVHPISAPHLVHQAAPQGLNMGDEPYDVPPIEEEYGNPGYTMCDMSCVWVEGIGARRTRPICADKTRFLMTSEDGTHHCIALKP